MRRASVLGFILLGIFALNAVCLSATGGGWLATGTVTRIDANTMYFLGRDNVVYEIDTSGAQMFTQAGATNAQPEVGDQVRVYGYLSKPGHIVASRVRVLASPADRSAPPSAAPEKEIKIVVEKEIPPDITQQPAQPEQSASAQAVSPIAEATWQGKGLISDVDYRGRQIKLQTSGGSFTINVNTAIMVRGTVRASLASLNQGDAIWVAGNEVAPFVVQASAVRVLRTASEAANAVPMIPTSVVGVIQQIDYPSRTFKMTGRVTTAVVSCDDDTVIQFQQIKKTFLDLKPGTRINMSGYGNLASGYAAQHIQIIAVSP
ncbi:MAG: DUF5666 domain-containing protein [Armatimonadota bacterium]